jgi:hypothetical protein
LCTFLVRAVKATVWKMNAQFYLHHYPTDYN